MRNKIRRNPLVSYNAQMEMRAEDAFRSRTHPNSILNDGRQREASAEARRHAPHRARGKRSLPPQPSYDLSTGEVMALVASGFRVADRRVNGTHVVVLPV